MDSAKVNELRVIALFDGRPGHEKQTMGIIRALQARVPVRLIRINVHRFSLLKEVGQTCRLYLPGGWFGGLSHPEISKGDFLIGAGSRTHLPMLLYGKRYEIPAITCMTPARHLRSRFDLCFVPEHEGVREQGNIMLTVGAPNCSRNRGNHLSEYGLILLGGVDNKSHYWESEQIGNMVEKLVKTESQKIWTVSSSPRTPQETVTRMRELSKMYSNVKYFDFTETPSGWIEEQYDKNSVVWVTVDSISMIYEALTAGCRVGIFPVKWRSQTSKFKKNEDILLERGLVTAFSVWERGNLKDGKTEVLNEAERCADRILQRWWQKNLPDNNH